MPATTYALNMFVDLNDNSVNGFFKDEAGHRYWLMSTTPSDDRSFLPANGDYARSSAGIWGPTLRQKLGDILKLAVIIENLGERNITDMKIYAAFSRARKQSDSPRMFSSPISHPNGRPNCLVGLDLTPELTRFPPNLISYSVNMPTSVPASVTPRDGKKLKYEFSMIVTFKLDGDIRHYSYDPELDVDVTGNR